jgi:hypothetical protein
MTILKKTYSHTQQKRLDWIVGLKWVETVERDICIRVPVDIEQKR